MIWKDFLRKTRSELAEYLKKDIQYKNLSKNTVFHIAWREIELFVEKFKNWSPEKLVLKENTKISRLDQEKLISFLEKRRKGIPLAYITGQQEFYGLNFKVSKNTLIPRPETEELVERALKFLSRHFKSSSGPIVLIDVGTGSGCIIVSVVKHIPASVSNWQAYGVDISEKALEVAESNACKLLGYKNKIKFIKGSLLNFILSRDAKFCVSTKYIILANLPYLSRKEYDNLGREVKNNEPKQALAGGPRGHEKICELITQISRLKQHGVAFLELSTTTFPAIKQYCAPDGTQGQTRLLNVRKFTDINGNIRIMRINF